MLKPSCTHSEDMDICNEVSVSLTSCLDMSHRSFSNLTGKVFMNKMRDMVDTLSS